MRSCCHEDFQSYRATVQGKRFPRDRLWKKRTQEQSERKKGVNSEYEEYSFDLKVMVYIYLEIQVDSSTFDCIFNDF